jgi:hypothetical protein
VPLKSLSAPCDKAGAFYTSLPSFARLSRSVGGEGRSEGDLVLPAGGVYREGKQDAGAFFRSLLRVAALLCTLDVQVAPRGLFYPATRLS